MFNFKKRKKRSEERSALRKMIRKKKDPSKGKTWKNEKGKKENNNNGKGKNIEGKNWRPLHGTVSKKGERYGRKSAEVVRKGKKGLTIRKKIAGMSGKVLKS